MPAQRSPHRNRLELLAFEALRWTLLLVPEKAAYAAGRGLGRLFRRLDARRRRRTLENLAAAFPGLAPEAVERLSRAVFAHFGELAAFLARAVDEPIGSLLGRVTITGAEHARAAAASGRGVFLLTPHLGNWEMAALATAASGLPTTVIARPLDNPLLEKRLRAFRERNGNRVVPKSQAAREMLRVLRSGGVIGILPDQHARPPDAVVAPFFGRPALTTSSVARLSARTGALMVPSVCLVTAPGRFRFEIHPPVDITTLPEEERTPEAFTARINGIIEGMVRDHPAQWLWLHDRWRM